MARAVALVGCACAGLAGLSAPATSAQVVIRERVDVTAPEAAPEPTMDVVAPADSAACALPVVAYAVYRGSLGPSGNVWSGGAELSGPLAITTTCGHASANVQTGFVLDLPPNDIWEGHFRGEDRYNYSPDASREILRVPLRAVEEIERQKLTVAGEKRFFTGGLSDALACTYYSACATPPRGASLGISFEIEGWATAHAQVWPDSVACGTSTPLPLTFVKADGSEGYAGTGAGLRYRIPGWSAASQGGLAYDGTTSGDVWVPYPAVRAGAVRLVAPPCETMSSGPLGWTLWGEGAPGGLVSHAVTVVPPPPTRFNVGASADTVGAVAPDPSGAWLWTVALSGDEEETYLDPATEVTLTVSDAALAYLDYRTSGSSTVLNGPSITVPYSGARGGVTFGTFSGNRPACDTPVMVTASGGGLSGSAEIVIRGADLVADSLAVSAAPNPVAHGDSAAVSVTARSGAGCDVSGSVPDLTLMTVEVSTAAYGGLVYGGQESATLSVPYGDLRAGLVDFVANGSVPPRDRYVEVTVTGSGLVGTTLLVVEGPGPCDEGAPCASGEAGQQTFGSTNVRVREPGQSLTWGSGNSLVVQPEPLPATPLAGITRPRFELTSPVGDTLDVVRGDHLDFRACLVGGRWVARVDSFFVPVVPEDFIAEAGYVDVRDTTAAVFDALVASGAITSADTTDLLLDLEFERFGPYAFDFYARVFRLTDRNGVIFGAYIDTTDAAMGQVWRDLVRPHAPAIAQYVQDRSVPRHARLYHSSAGVLIHERNHVPSLTQDLADAMNSLFTALDLEINRDRIRCAEDVIQLASRRVRGAEEAFRRHQVAKPPAELQDGHLWWRHELESDAIARPHFVDLLDAIRNRHLPRAFP